MAIIYRVLEGIAGDNSAFLTRRGGLTIYGSMNSMRFPFKTLLVLGVLCFVLVDYPPLKLQLAYNKDMVKKAEFYPVSSFPMYSTFSDSPFLVFVTDGLGEKIAIDTSLKTHASEIKKTYELRLKAQKNQAGLDGRVTDIPLATKEEAGRATLTLLRERPSVQEYLATRSDPALQLHEIVLTAGATGIEQRETFVAELR